MDRLALEAYGTEHRRRAASAGTRGKGKGGSKRASGGGSSESSAEDDEEEQEEGHGLFSRARGGSDGGGSGAASQAGCGTCCRLLCDPIMWKFALSSLCHGVAFWGVIFWVPQVVASVRAGSDESPFLFPHDAFSGGDDAVSTLIDHLDTDVDASAAEADGSAGGGGGGTRALLAAAVARGAARRLLDMGQVVLSSASTLEAADSTHSRTSGSISDTVAVDLLSAVPYTFAVIGNLLNSWHSDKTGERRWHLIGALLLGSFGLLLTGSTLHRPFANLIALSLTAFAFWAVSGPFWGLVNELTPDDNDAAVFTALVNSIGNIGGFIGPLVVGLVHEHTHSFRPVMLILAATAAAGVLPICCLERRSPMSPRKKRRAPLH